MKTWKKIVVVISLALFMFMGGISNVTADPHEGVVVSVHRHGGNLVRLRVYVDTTGNRIADTVLMFLDPASNAIARNIEMFIEKGMRVTFDDNDFFIEDNMKFVAGSNTITIDGTNMIELFPNEAARFKFAAQARTSTPASPPQSAEERRIAELEAELQRLKQGR